VGNYRSSAILRLISAMVIFGTVGLFRKEISLPSGFISFCRGIIGFLVIVLFLLVAKKGFSFVSVRKNIWLLAASGICMGFNWILLFESYNNTTIAKATLYYYLSPTFVIFLAPLVLKERLTFKRLICAFAALVGMVFVSGVITDTNVSQNEIIGIICGIGAAVLYASVVLINQKMTEISPFERTTTQLFSASVVLLPYVLIAENINVGDFELKSVIMLIILGVLHTGICYAMYFSVMGKLRAQTVAIFSYIDPVVALFVSMFLLNEMPDKTLDLILQLAGAVLILGSALIGELIPQKVGEK